MVTHSPMSTQLPKHSSRNEGKANRPIIIKIEKRNAGNDRLAKFYLKRFFAAFSFSFDGSKKSLSWWRTKTLLEKRQPRTKPDTKKSFFLFRYPQEVQYFKVQRKGWTKVSSFKTSRPPIQLQKDPFVRQISSWTHFRRHQLVLEVVALVKPSPFFTRAGTGSHFWDSCCFGNLFISSSLCQKVRAEGYWALEILRTFLKLNMSRILSSPVEPAKKLAGLVKIWARVVTGIGLLYCQLFSKPGPPSPVGWPFQLYFYTRVLSVCLFVPVSALLIRTHMCRSDWNLSV